MRVFSVNLEEVKDLIIEIVAEDAELMSFLEECADYGEDMFYGIIKYVVAESCAYPYEVGYRGFIPALPEHEDESNIHKCLMDIVHELRASPTFKEMFDHVTGLPFDVRVVNDLIILKTA